VTPPAPTSRAAIWLLAIRPATLTAAIAPVLVGTALAQRAGGARLGPALAALLGALLLQIGVNLANDADDFERGADTGARRGPTRVTQSGLLRSDEVHRAAWLSFGLAALVGCYLVAHAGWPILVLGLAAIAAGWAYTGGPWPLGYHGLGEVFVFLFFGLAAVLGTTYVQTTALSWFDLLAALPVCTLVTAILVVNNTRDIDNDRRAGKRTLAVRGGASMMRALYTLLLGLAYAIPAIVGVSGVSSAAVWLPWLTAPWGVRLALAMWRAREGPAFNQLLRDTARLHLLFGVLFAVGLSI
jgi:1,4-dihydroxy-2-naphthoate octaprenyltransferase